MSKNGPSPESQPPPKPPHGSGLKRIARQALDAVFQGGAEQPETAQAQQKLATGEEAAPRLEEPAEVPRAIQPKRFPRALQLFPDLQPQFRVVIQPLNEVHFLYASGRHHYAPPVRPESAGRAQRMGEQLADLYLAVGKGNHNIASVTTGLGKEPPAVMGVVRRLARELPDEILDYWAGWRSLAILLSFHACQLLTNEQDYTRTQRQERNAYHKQDAPASNATGKPKKLPAKTI